MWRSLFLALGIFTLLLGLQALVIDSATFANHGEATGNHDLIPAEWAPWSLLSAGAVVILYSFTLPQKLKGG
ncbi:MAG TPA: hypothetical protein VKB78_13755 [Pirellulales bacterium]|nr:hypothetical protein [Pirellulales bacterium]